MKIQDETKLIEKIYEGKFKEFDINLLNKEVRMFFKNINFNPKINLKVIEMPKLILEKGFDGYMLRGKEKNFYIFLKKSLSREERLQTFWHEVGHVLFKVFVSKKLKKEILRDIQPLKSLQQFEKEMKEYQEFYSFDKIGEEFVCELFADSTEKKGYVPLNIKNCVIPLKNIVIAYNILIEEFSLLSSD